MPKKGKPTQMTHGERVAAKRRLATEVAETSGLTIQAPESFAAQLKPNEIGPNRVKYPPLTGVNLSRAVLEGRGHKRGKN